jgi:hypothetical protein
LYASEAVQSDTNIEPMLFDFQSCQALTSSKSHKPNHIHLPMSSLAEHKIERESKSGSGSPEPLFHDTIQIVVWN